MRGEGKDEGEGVRMGGDMKWSQEGNNMWIRRWGGWGGGGSNGMGRRKEGS